MARFEKHISGCWLWTGSVNKYGYGNIGKATGGGFTAHRISWEIFNGAIPEGMCVCHRCDVRRCVNPEHLFLGTNFDNSMDRVAKGRTASGDRSGRRKKPENWAHVRGELTSNAKLTEQQVRAIRADGRPHAEIANDYGLSKTHVSNLRRGKSWSHI